MLNTDDLKPASEKHHLNSINENIIPIDAGVYIFYDRTEKPIYIGKAKNIRNRLKQYLSGQDERPLIPYLLKDAQFIGFILAGSEKEALVLENNLIKQHRPKYNIDLKDDKSYPYLAITKEDFPQLIITRKPWKKFKFIKGPFTDAGILRNLLRILLAAYPLRRCGRMGKKPCVNFQIGLCPAPCGNITKEEYGKRVEKITALIEGKGWRDFSQTLRADIEAAARDLQFEKAGRLRDALAILPDITDKLAVEIAGRKREDYFLFSFHAASVFITAAQYTDGKLSGIRHLFNNRLGDDRESIMLSCLSSFYQYYQLPEKLAFSPDCDIDTEIIENVLGKTVKTRIPGHVLDFIGRNHQEYLDSFFRKEDELNKILAELSGFTGKAIRSILCVDASTFYGNYTVVGAVWWENGAFIKSNYRRFRIKTVEGTDDYASLAEMSARIKERWEKSNWPKPSLMLIDGGKGQLSSVLNVLGVDITAAGIIKDRSGKKGMEKLVDISGNEMELIDSPLAFLLMRIRDETHRFSIEYNKILRKEELSTGLLNIKGIGKSCEKKLLDHFKTLENIRTAKIEDFVKVKGISQKAAEAIFSYFHGG